MVTLGESENEDFWEWKGKVWSDQAYWTIKDFTFGGGLVNFCGKFPFTPNRFHLCFGNFIWCTVCFSKQKILSTYVWKVSRCLEKSVEVLAFNSFVSVSLVLLMEGFLEGTQTSSVEKHNTVWQCERLKVLTFYLTPVTLLYIVWRVQSAFLHHLNLSNTTTESSYLFVLLYDKLFLEILGAEKFQTYVLWCMHLYPSQTCLIFVSSCSSYLSNGHDVIFNSGL